MPHGNAGTNHTAFPGKRVMFQRSRTTAVVGGPNNGVPFDFTYWTPQLAGRAIWQSISSCGLESASTITPDSPARAPDPAQGARLLASAGYVRGADGRWTLDGRALRLRLAAPAQASPYGRLVDTVAQELNAAGIGTTLVADSGARQQCSNGVSAAIFNVSISGNLATSAPGAFATADNTFTSK